MRRTRRNLAAATVSPFVKRRTIVLVGVCLLVFSAGAAVSLGAASAPGGDPFEQMEIEAEDVLMAVEVDADGDAMWTVEYRTRLADSEEEAAFEELREDIESDPEPYTDRFRERMERTAETAEEATGREMAIADVSVQADRRELARSYGVVTYEFRWTGFAAVDGDRITAGDALDGLFLDDETSFIVSWPDSHALVDVSPPPSETRDGAVVWNGPLDFTADEPRVAIEPAGADGGVTDDGPAGDDVEDGDQPNGEQGTDESVSAVTVVAVVAALLLVLGGATYYRRMGGVADGTGEGDGSTSTGRSSSSGGDAVTATNDADTPGSDVSDGGPTDTGVDDHDGSGEADEVGDPDDADDAVDPALLSNEEQVLRLIEERGGRMKQAEVAEELDWTAAKTSQVVTGLRDEGTLDGFRLGRENVLSLPDEDPTGADGARGEETE